MKTLQQKLKAARKAHARHVRREKAEARERRRVRLAILTANPVCQYAKAPAAGLWPWVAVAAAIVLALVIL